MKRERSNRAKGSVLDESGYIMIMALLVFALVIIIGVALIVLGVTEIKLAKRYNMMDQAYADADAGMDRGVMAIASNVVDSENGVALAEDTTPGLQHVITERFQDDNNAYLVEVYQDDQNPGSSHFKKVVSRGTFIWGSGAGASTVERTVEARMYIPVLGKDYDASFDYCIFNGFNHEGGEGTWPGTTFWVGNFTWDGGTPYKGHAPKGALYTRGNIELETNVAGYLEIIGPTAAGEGAAMVATDNIELYNSLGIGGIQVTGNAVAGVDSTAPGDAVVETKAVAGWHEPISIDSGSLVAYGDASVESTGTVLLNNPIQIAGIIAGGNVSIEGTVNISKALDINGPIISHGSTTVESRWLNGIDIQSIWAGENASHLGVDLDTEAASSIDVTAGITSTGKVNMEADLAGIDVGGTIKAGNDNGTGTGGEGLYFDMDWASGVETGDIESTGKVRLAANGISTIKTGAIDAGYGGDGVGVSWEGTLLSSITCDNGDPLKYVTSLGDVEANMAQGSNISGVGAIWSGGDVDLNAGEWFFVDDSISTGDISAEGFVHTYTGDDLTVGDVEAEGYVDLETRDNMVTGSVKCNGPATVRSYENILGIDFGNSVRVGGSILSRGNVYYECCANPFDLHLDSKIGDWADGGVWGQNVDIIRRDLADVTDTDLDPIGHILGFGNDSIRATGNVYLKGAGDLWWGEDMFLGDVRLGGSLSIWKNWQGWDGVDMGSEINSNPGLPDLNPSPTSVLLDVATPNNPNKPTAPQVGHNAAAPYDVDVLYEAGLESTVRLLEPSWGHFRDKAMKDDAVDNTPPHMISDTGLVADGDHDGLAGNDEIGFEWTSGAGGYSSNETIFSDEENVSVIIDKLSFPSGVDEYEGTIVARGDVYIDAGETNWFVDEYQSINITSGGDIRRRTSGFTIWDNKECHFHFYAYRNIDLTNMRFALGSSELFYGSFTAGNRVYYRSNSVFQDCTFRWSRWALDPVGWAPPFKILSWREV